MVRLCSVKGCTKKHNAQGYCGRHYVLWIRHGDPLYVPVHVTRLCSIEGCEKKHRGNDFCTFHNDKFRRHGDPLHISDPKEKSRKLSKANKGQIAWNKGKIGIYSNKTLKKMSDARMGKKLSEEQKKKISAAVTKALSDPIIRKKISDFHSTPERKAKQRQVLRDMRHNQTSPTVPESIIMEILNEGGIKYKFNIHVDYLTPENKHRKKEIDFLIKPKKIIEFNGYRHYDNRNFKPDTMVTHHNKLKKCQDIWDEENMILNQIRKEGYEILVVWQLDWKKERDKTTKKILKFANSETLS